METVKKKEILAPQEKQRRIDHGIQQLLGGDLSALESREICEAVPEAVIQSIENRADDKANSLLMQMAIASRQDNQELRKQGSKAMGKTAALLKEHAQWERLAKLIPAIAESIHLTAEDEELVKAAFSAVAGLARKLLQEEEYFKAHEPVHVLCQASISPHYSDQASQYIEALLAQLGEQPLLENLVREYLQQPKSKSNQARLLIALGKNAANYLLQCLVNSEEKDERRILLGLLEQYGHFAKQLFLDQLARPAPWYISRNIIRLLASVDDSEIVVHLKPFTRHPDQRVQQEALNTAVKLGGKQLPDFLVHSLTTMQDELKTRIVFQMINVPNEIYVPPLLHLLEGRSSISPQAKNALMQTICRALAAVCSKEAIPALHRVSQSKGVLGITGYPDEVREAARTALQRIRKSFVTDNRVSPSSQDAHSNRHLEQRSAAQSAGTNTEDTIFLMAEQGKTKEAKQALFDLVVATARAGDFANAERLRERIYEIDPLALSEIIRSGEIIEQEKSGAINHDDLIIWSELTDELTTEEFQTIYHELQELSFAPEETIIRQGAKSDALYFVNQGSVKVSHLADGKEMFITSLNRGELIGENFFDPSVWTVSLTALTEVRIYQLKQEKLDKWQERFPGLGRKLKLFYDSHNHVPEVLKKKGLERRRHQRFNVTRKILVQPVNRENKPFGRTFKAEIADISAGGLTFLIRITSQGNTRLLLGRKLMIIIPIAEKDTPLALLGTSIGVQPHDVFTSDYSVHFKFDELLSNADLQSIAA
ncbi:MAG: hypothetical protein CSA32_00635 [Desulfobulbus propionicus]|nr:MAG: hypothetical protein CSA32_00635 [Desulfobulbus propionicus]